MPRIFTVDSDFNFTEVPRDQLHDHPKVAAALEATWAEFLTLESAFFAEEHAKVREALAAARGSIAASGVPELIARHSLARIELLPSYKYLQEQIDRTEEERHAWERRVFDNVAFWAIQYELSSLREALAKSESNDHSQNDSARSESVAIERTQLEPELESLKADILRKMIEEQIFEPKQRAYAYNISQLQDEVGDLIEYELQLETGYLIAQKRLPDTGWLVGRVALRVKRLFRLEQRTSMQMLEDAIEEERIFQDERQRIWNERYAYYASFIHDDQEDFGWNNQSGRGQANESRTDKNVHKRELKFYGIIISNEDKERIESLGIPEMFEQLKAIIRSGDSTAAKRYARTIRTQFHPDRHPDLSAEDNIPKVVNAALDQLTKNP